MTAAESKATYEEIKAYVAEHNDGMKVSNLYIAQVKAKYGIIERENYNKPKSDDARQPKCPKEKEEAIVEALSLLEEGCLEPVPQDEELSSYAPLITKGMGKIDFSGSAYEIELKVRGMNPWPSAFTTYHGKQLKIWEAVAEEKAPKEASCGKILEVNKDCVVIGTGKGILKIYSLQLEGKKRMSAHDFLLGVRMQVGETLGE